jgi:hypothetical protein
MLKKSPCGTWTSVKLGLVPVDIVKNYLRIDLVPGPIIFHWDAQKHAFGADERKHREPICSPHYTNTIADPTHIGQQPKYIGDAFDLVRVVSDKGPIIIMGIGLEPNKRGIYSVRSTYPLDFNSLGRRVRLKTTFKIIG